MILKTATVSSKGQVAIPVEIREKAGIETGDELVFLFNAGNLVVKRAKDISKQVETDYKEMLEHLEYTLNKVWDNEEDEHWNDYPRRHPTRAIPIHRSEQQKTTTRSGDLKQKKKR